MVQNVRIKGWCRIGRGLQGLWSIATKLIATTIFCCNKIRCYHIIPVHGNRINIMPQCRFVTPITPFVAIEVMYCHKVHQYCNIVVILQEVCHAAEISHFVAIAPMYCNNVNLCGNILTYIATILTCGASHGYCCKKWLHTAMKHVLVVNYKDPGLSHHDRSSQYMLIYGDKYLLPWNNIRW